MIRSTLMLAALALLAPATYADDKPAQKPADKEVKLTGTLVCAKCKLKLDGVKNCTNALQVEEKGKTVTYLLEDTGHAEDYHQCGGGEEKGVTVTGTLSEKEGTKWVKPTKVSLKK